MPTAFIGHSQADAPIARQIEAALRDFGVDSSDAEETSFGVNVNHAIMDALMDADAYIFVVSENFSKSEWANVELAAAVADTMGGLAKPIIPVLVGSVDPSRDLPELLRRYVWLDLRQGISKARLTQLAASIQHRHRLENTKTQLDSEEELLRLRQIQLDRERLEYRRTMAVEAAWGTRRFTRGALLVAALTLVGCLTTLVLSLVKSEKSGAALAVTGVLVGVALTLLIQTRLVLHSRYRSANSHEGPEP